MTDEGGSLNAQAPNEPPPVHPSSFRPHPSTLHSDQLRALDKRYVWHPFTHMRQWLADDHQPLVIAAAEGMHLIDSDGNRYLDGVSSLWANVHGHRVPEIDAAIRAQLDKVAHTTMLGLASEPAILLAERLVNLAPPGLAKVFYSDAGATATEIAFKLAAQYWYNVGRPEKCEFVGFSEAYHGDTVGAMSVGRTAAFHRPYFPLLFKVHYAPTPFAYRWDPSATPGGGGGGGSAEEIKQACLAELERVLATRSGAIAAVCIEPIVQGAAGMIVHPSGFLRGVRELCTKYDVLLICDEVAVGFGRTGRMFACGHEGVSPDLMCVAKGITGGYLPLAATLATQRIFDAFLGEPSDGRTFFHGHTYTGNPLACAAALASLELFQKNDLVRAVQRKSEALSALLDARVRPLPHVGDVRQKGFMVGIQLVADRATRRPFDAKRRVGAEVCARVRRHGVIVRPLGDVVVLMPPLAMGVEDLRTIVEAVAAEVASLSA
ncbi:MAG TPA: adenosylmethionine--8-amino-7-oxononanoate transaminase [Tepidisphaeraceae bacterium]|nr:adenosylmethionine--8-amino-7-oxononanoate transaminase [Tepidisphaeraceae bacterium]